MRCGGSGKIEYEIVHPDFPSEISYGTYEKDCPGCEECPCEICEGGLTWSGKDWEKPQTCPTCHGTGRKVSDER